MIYNSYDNVGLVKVLSFLKSHNSEYLSGQDLSDVLKISRVAVWKHIKKIQTLGYKVESKQKLGYRLSELTNLLLPWEIKDGLNTEFIGNRVYYFDTIDSTQNFAMKIAKDPKENGSVVIAERQTRGRGRLERRWESPKGGIWLSVIFHPEFDSSLSTVFPLAASLALARAIEKKLDLKPKLKWPNDVTIDGRKVAGILVDASLEFSKIENLVLGVGINFNVNVKTMKQMIKNSANYYGVSSLWTKSKNLSAIELVQTFLLELEKAYYKINEEKTSSILRQWSKRSSTIGKDVTILAESGKITGKAIKVDKDGALVISKNGKTDRILAGDIIIKN